ncbi:MAG: hypothetical protein WBA99_10955 [Nodosilinea sp.]
MPGSLPDRLGAALEAIVISDRWVTDRRGFVAEAEGGWQGGLLRVVRACAQGDALLPQRWRPHFQALPDRAAVLLNAFPYLWLQADAYGHHAAGVADWAIGLGRSAATVGGCGDLFSLICQEMNAAGAGETGVGAPDRKANPLGAVLQLVTASQGEFAVVLGAAHQRGWAGPDVALAALVVGLTRGRGGVPACLRQRWLVERSEAGQEGWGGLDAENLAAIAASLHYRWSGGEPSDRLDRHCFPLGIRV